MRVSFRTFYLMCCWMWTTCLSLFSLRITSISVFAFVGSYQETWFLLFAKNPFSVILYRQTTTFKKGWSLPQDVVTLNLFLPLISGSDCIQLTVQIVFWHHTAYSYNPLDVLRLFKNMNSVFSLMFWFRSDLWCWGGLPLAQLILRSVSFSAILNLFLLIHKPSYLLCYLFTNSRSCVILMDSV